MTTVKKPLILVDGSSYLYRAFHAMPSFTNSKGFPTGAVYGVVNMLRKLISDYDPEYMALIFDAPGKTFRDALYEKYKANRQQMPAELIQQIEIIHKIIKAMGLPLFMIEGVEADDVIGTLAKHAANKGMCTLVSTGDKDLAQLVDDKITLVNTMSNSVLNRETVVEKFGIPPELIIDYLTLVGDSIDNIPGVPQVGPKTAAKWLQQYGSLDNLIANADKISGKVGENLRNSIPHLPLSKQLATIKLDVDLTIDLPDLQRKQPDNDSLRQWYKELEFKNWLSELLEEKSHELKETHKAYETILSEKQLTAWITKISKEKFFAFSLETSTHNYMDAEIIGIAFAVAPGQAAYLPLGQTSLLLLKPIFENADIIKIGHDIKFNMEVLANHNIMLQGAQYDIMLESYILDSASNNHDLASLALKYLGWRTTAYDEIAGKGAKQIAFSEIPIETATTFAAEKTDVILQLHHTLWSKLNSESGLKFIFEKIEMPLLPVLERMERHGVFVDTNLLNQQTIEFENRLIELEKEAFSLAESSFNLNSPKQLQEILFSKLKLPVLQKTPTGQPSTADAVLQELAMDYRLPKLIIEYRALSKLISTYTRRLPEQINVKTKRVHTCYNQTVAATGRLSSSDPNLQNIPIRTLEGRRIRQAFIAPPGYKILAADYSQIELRIMAHISQDPNLLKAFANNMDIHTATAAEVLDVPIDQVSSEERRRAKAVNFGLIYGMSSFGLGKQLGLDRQAAQAYIDRYFSRYPKVKEYMEKTCKTAHEKGFVETLLGRRLYLSDINSSQFMRQKAAERAAINAPLQGTAADIIKLAMIALDKKLSLEKIDAKMIMQVHDELVFEVAEQDVKRMTELVRTAMMDAAELSVPLLVDIGVSDNWNEAAG